LLGCVATDEVERHQVTPERPLLCDRPGDDAVRDVFCDSIRPNITGLYDLELALGLQTQPSTHGVTYHNHPILLGHSTALSGHLTSPINPRAFFVGDDIVLAFQRGAQRAEVAALDRERERFNFYLFRFSQACNIAATGCSHADMFTARIEAEWQSVTLEDDEDLKNTTLDCRQCHQRGRRAPGLLMRELESPWTHFFDSIPASTGDSPGVRGSDLLRDYMAAHGSEPYAGVDVENYPTIAPFALERLVGRSQPLVFDTRAIEAERWPKDRESYAATPQPSATWERAFAAFRRGEQLALPYLEVRATDPAKQARLSAAYRAHASGSLHADLPDLADVFPDAEAVRARIGLQTEPGASAVETLIQACGPCHNAALDQSVSRARFNIDLSRLAPDEIENAVERLERDPTDPLVMPPVDGRQLTAAARERLIAYLIEAASHPEPVPELVRASAYGMTGRLVPSE
jgi:hypothetical protein